MNDKCVALRRYTILIHLVVVMLTPLFDFTKSLWDGGELLLASSEAPTPADLDARIDFVQSTEIDYRKTLPAGVPPLNLPAIQWALTSLHRVAQFLVFRELPLEMLRTDLDRPCPEKQSASTSYSVDLSFRFLPDLLRLTRAISSQDPLIEFLRLWGADWQPSSVGIADIEPGPVDVILKNPALCTIYVDRILATGDIGRLRDPQTAEAVRTALGGFRELSPAIYDLVQQ
jgi:hypothetical protein